MYKILIVDDHLIYAQSLQMVLQTKEDILKIFVATSTDQAISLLEEAEIDICLTDIAMPDRSGLELYSYILENFPKIKVVAISGLMQNQAFAMLWQEGIHGLMHKSEAASVLIQAIDTVNSGKRYLSKKVAFNLQNDTSILAYEQLTKREKQVLKLIAEGTSISNIAEKLNISKKTVRNHRDRLMIKTNSHSAIELILFCVQAGIVTGGAS